MLEQGWQLQEEAMAQDAAAQRAALEARSQELQLQREQLELEAVRLDLERRTVELAASERSLAARQRVLQQRRAEQEVQQAEQRAQLDQRAEELSAAIEAAAAAEAVVAAGKPAGDVPSPAARVWVPDLIRSIAAHLGPNEVLLTLQRVNRSWVPPARRIRMSQPVPPYAFARQWGKPTAAASATAAGAAGGRGNSGGGSQRGTAMRRLPREQRERLLACTIKSGVVENVALLLDDWPDCFSLGRHHMTLATVAGHVDMLELLHSRGCPMANNGIDLAAEAGRREAVVWLLDNGYRPDSGVIDPGYGDEPQATPEEGAARGGHEAFMQELLARRSGPAASGWPLASRGLLLGWLAIHAARYHPLAELQRHWSDLLGHMGGRHFAAVAARGDGRSENGHYDEPLKLPEYFLFKALDAAACSVTEDWQAKVRWLTRDKGHWPTQVKRDGGWTVAPRERWEWLLQQGGYDLGLQYALKAVAQGWVPELRLLVQGSSQPPAPGRASAKPPRTLHRFSDEDKTAICVAAAEAGRVACLEYIRGLECWLGCSGPDIKRRGAVLDAAARSGSPAFLEWVFEVLLGGLESTLSNCVPAEAARSGAPGSIAVLSWLLRRGYQWNMHAFSAAVGTRNIQLLEWMWERRCPVEGGGAYIWAVRAACAIDPGDEVPRRFHSYHSVFFINPYTAVRAVSGEGVGVSISSGGGGGGGAADGRPVSRVELLEWLHARGLRPTDAEAFVAAAAVGDQTVLEWWAAKGLPMGDPGRAYWETGGDLATLRTLHACGAPLAPDTFLGAIVHPGDYFPPGHEAIDDYGEVVDGHISYDDGPRTWGLAAVRMLAEEAGAAVDEEQAALRAAYRRKWFGETGRDEVAAYVEGLLAARRMARR
eukprot:XP_001690374.1 predicted protein [Chlamydomonas reinhardtii]